MSRITWVEGSVPVPGLASRWGWTPAPRRPTGPARATQARALLLALALAIANLAASAHADGGLVSPKIVNGVATQTQPATGALLVPFGSGYLSGCSGTLIGCQTFLTAAHCVCPGSTACSPDPNGYAVYLQNAGIHAVSAIDVHPSFNFAVAADVAVVTLAAPVSGIPPMPINTSVTPPLGSTGTIVGFGVTGGNNLDGGVLRQGQVVTSSCSGLVPEPEHVCWVFQSPFGPPGQDSNTCSGDSGGPLFVDLGAGPVVAGITSGGTSTACTGTDFSFDANVFLYQSFIQGVAGSDLSNTSCGSHSQVGDPLTTVTAWSRSGLPTKEERICRREVERQIRVYAKKRHNLMRRCIDGVQKGSKVGPCPDAATLTKLQKAIAKVDPVRLDARCPAAVLPGAQLGGVCASAQNGTDLAACILAEADLQVDDMLDVAYADVAATTALPDSGLASCQRAIGAEFGRYAHRRIARLAACVRKSDLGKVAGCPDAKTDATIALFASKAQSHLTARCTDAQVASLDAAAGFGDTCAGVTTVAGLAACGLPEHEDSGDAILDLVPEVAGGDDLRSFVVPVGADRFRVTLNGIDDPASDLDLYVKLGAPPTPTDFDLASTGSGVFEFVEQLSPAAGTWYVLIDEVAGTAVEYQATATVFQP